MDLAALRVDREVGRRLGVDGLQAIADRLDPCGDCVVCHRTLGTSPVTLSLHWKGQSQDLALVAPADGDPVAGVLAQADVPRYGAPQVWVV